MIMSHTCTFTLNIPTCSWLYISIHWQMRSHISYTHTYVTFGICMGLICWPSSTVLRWRSKFKICWQEATQQNSLAQSPKLKERRRGKGAQMPFQLKRFTFLSLFFNLSVPWMSALWKRTGYLLHDDKSLSKESKRVGSPKYPGPELQLWCL